MVTDTDHRKTESTSDTGATETWMIIIIDYNL